jgi:hypothetical protein
MGEDMKRKSNNNNEKAAEKREDGDDDTRAAAHALHPCAALACLSHLRLTASTVPPRVALEHARAQGARPAQHERALRRRLVDERLTPSIRRQWPPRAHVAPA